MSNSASRKRIRPKPLDTQAPPLERVERAERLPLSFAQQRLWFLDQLEPGSSFYNIPAAMRLSGTLNVEALEWTLSEVVRRHEVLRTHFIAVDGEPVQVIEAAAPLKLEVFDLSTLEEAERTAETERLVAAESARPFDLMRGPLLRVSLLRLGEEEHVALVTMHHIVSDGWSIGVLVREVAVLYSAYVRGDESPLEELPIQYVDFAHWQRAWLQGEVLDSQLDYWRAELADAPTVIDLPLDKPRPPIQTFRGAHHPVELSAELSAQLRDLSRQHGSTLFMTLLAAFDLLLCRYAGQADIVVGSPIAGRNFVETEELIGFFVNTLVLRTDLSGNPTFRELVGQVREVALGAYLHQDVPFEKLVEELQPERHTSHSPLYQVMFELQNAPLGGLELPGVSLELLAAENATAKFDLTLNLQERDEVIDGSLSYSTDLFEAETIGRMVSHFLTLLEDASKHPDRRVSELEMMSIEEREQLAHAWNDTQSAYPQNTLVHELFELQVERRPEAIAVVCEGEKITYSELNCRANETARRLRKSGVGPETLVGVGLARSIEMVVALFGILKAGGAFVFFDLTYPKERLAFLLADTGVRLLLTEHHLLEDLPPFAGEIMFPEEGGATKAIGPIRPIKVDPEQLAYVFYTSGSTGQPKGVLTSHRGVVNYLTFNTKAYQLSDADTVLQIASLSFDASVRDILGPLVVGARLLLVNNTDARDPEALLAKISEQRVTCLLSVVPSLLHALTEAAARRAHTPEQLRLILTSGENLLLSECARARAAFGQDLTIVNQYGPTECTMTQSFYSVPRAETGTGTSLAGKPIANVQLYILDDRLRLVPIGVSGEVAIGGVGVTRGYLNNPAQTAERFIPHPFSREPGARLYRTGDLARYRSSGDIELLGRIDHQVKLRGYRIELGEIEWALHQHPQISEVVVVLREEQLVAYVVGVDERVISSTELRQFLRVKVPDYMVPARFVQLERLPLTANGKVDRRALQELAVESAGGGELVLARTPVEEILSGIWAEVLGCETVSVYDSFLELGGHSLLATQVISRIRDVFGQELTLRTLLENPTVASLARTIEGGQSIVGGPKTPPIVRIESTGRAPASFAQQSLWLLHQLEPGKVFSNFPAVSTLTGTLNFEALVSALTAMTQRHEVLRTTFTSVDGELRQIISPAESFDLPLVDLSEIPDKARETETRRLISKEAGQPFDLARGPLMRGKLLRLSAEEHVALLTIHPIVLDLWSISIFLREVAALYRAFHEGQPSPLGALQVQYADFAHWQQQWFQGQVFEQQLHYWRQQLAGAPAALELKGKKPAPTVLTFRAAIQPIELSKEVAKKLKELVRQTGVTLFMSLLAAFDVLLYRYSGQSDLLVGTRIANRNQVETEGLIGIFIDTLVLRIDLSGDPTFIEVLQRVREVCLEAYAHQELPFVKLVEELQPDRSQSHSPLFQVMFIMGYQGIDRLELPGLSWSVHLIQNRTAKVDLLLSLWETNDGMGGYFKYNTDIFDESTIAKMVKHFQTLIENLVTDPQQHLSDSSFLSEDETMGLTFADFPESGLSQKDFESLILQLNSSSSLK